jgi:aspartyl-tRNA(Asn)/glutamyl-tRNA(Gln) amidotransferase subunit B
VEEIARGLPELPDAKKARFVALSLSAYDASVLVAEKDVADYFEAMLAEGADAKACANWLINEYFGRLNKAGLAIAGGPILPKAASAIVQMVAANLISGKTAKDVADMVWREGGDPRAIVKARGLEQLNDTAAIEGAIEAIIAANPDKVQDVKLKPKLIGWFVGQAMKATGGKANPQALNAILRRRLELPDEG